LGRLCFLHRDWFYHPTIDFAVATPTGLRQVFLGLLVLFSAHSPYYCFSENERSWDTATGEHGSNLPSLEVVDRFTNTAVLSLLPRVHSSFENYGLIRLSKEELTRTLDLTVDTFLRSPPYRVFDALFHFSD
jgi:hypothetical protein